MKKTTEEIVKELELLEDRFDSNYAMEINGYRKGISDAIDLLKDYATQCQQDNAETAINFAEWISDNGWIRDPFPQKGYDEDKLCYTNIATIDIHSDDKLQVYTIQELFETYLKNLNKQ